MSDRHAAVRRANRTETAEDYVEAIKDLIDRTGEARVRDLAVSFGVSHVTVSRTIERLQREGLVQTEPYRSIELTPAGETMAIASRQRHMAVLTFLIEAGVPLSIAEDDAEGIEHHVGPETLLALEAYVRRRRDQQGRGRQADTTAVPRVNAPSPPSPNRFERVRAAHAAELQEDYVEAIGDLIRERGEARVGDLAKGFGVSHVTVSRTIGRLQRDGLATTAPYRPVELTPKGRALALEARRRHGIVLSGLLALGVPPRAAEIDAEGVEHHVSEETLAVLSSLAQGHPPRPGPAPDQ